MRFIYALTVLAASGCSSAYKPSDYYKVQSNQIIPISVTKFKNKSAVGENYRCRSWGWFHSDLGDAFSDLTVDELTQYKGFEVLERDTIHQINENEVNLVNSEKTAAIPKGEFKKAKYTVVGVVDSFEYCSGRTALSAAGKVSEAILGVGGDQETAEVGVTLRLIDTASGKVIASASGEGKQTRTAMKLKGLSDTLDVSSGLFRQSSLGNAIKEAIHHGMTNLLTKAKI